MRFAVLALVFLLGGCASTVQDARKALDQIAQPKPVLTCKTVGAPDSSTTTCY